MASKSRSAGRTRDLSKVVKIDEAGIRDHLGKVVRGTVEETLNAMLDAEADRLVGARRYERSPDRVDTRAGHYPEAGRSAASAGSTRSPAR